MPGKNNARRQPPVFLPRFTALFHPENGEMPPLGRRTDAIFRAD
jgi:hypothetical protein